MKKGAGSRAVEIGLHHHPAESVGKKGARRQELGGRSLRSARGQVVSRGRANRADFQDRAGQAEARVAVVRVFRENGLKGGKSRAGGFFIGKQIWYGHSDSGA
jgi:hypothetical protein